MCKCIVYGLCCLGWNEWNTIGTCIDAVAAVIAVIVSSVIAYKIADNQSQQTELQIRISLFDKRYEIYQCFMKYWNIAKKYVDGENNNASKTLSCFDDYFFHEINNSSLETLYEQCIKLREEDVNERLKKTHDATEKLNIETNLVKDKDISVVSQIRYCYEKIPNVYKVEKFVEIVNQTALSVFDRDVDNWDSNFSQLKILWEDINKDKLKENLEKQLNLS